MFVEKILFWHYSGWLTFDFNLKKWRTVKQSYWGNLIISMITSKKVYTPPPPPPHDFSSVIMRPFLLYYAFSNICGFYWLPFLCLSSFNKPRLWFRKFHLQLQKKFHSRFSHCNIQLSVTAETHDISIIATILYPSGSIKYVIFVS